MLRGKGQEAGPSEEPGQDKPRKKLSFKEPEILGYYMQMKQSVGNRLSRKGRKEPATPTQAALPLLPESQVVPHDDMALQSQAMRVVRTVGQAFEVCHKLSINSPTPEEHEEDASTDPNHNQPAHNDNTKSELYSRGGSYDGGGGGNDSSSTLEAVSEAASPHLVGSPPPQRPLRLDIIPPPPTNPSTKTPLSGSGETVYSSPASGEALGRGVEVPMAGTPLSAHHEMQLLREQLDQQCQQTQAAVAQIHLLRDQLAAETAARLEAQARIHQLLVHNKELLDHISSLVQHLQEQEKLQGNHQVTAIPQMSPKSKVTRWFEMIQEPLSRPESGFVDSPEIEEPESLALISRLPTRKKRKLLGLKIGKVTTF